MVYDFMCMLDMSRNLQLFLGSTVFHSFALLEDDLRELYLLFSIFPTVINYFFFTAQTVSVRTANDLVILLGSALMWQYVTIAVFLGKHLESC